MVTCPTRVVIVILTEMLEALMVTPAGELAVKVSEAAGWNRFVPLG